MSTSRTGSPDGTDTLRSIEFLQFNDALVALWLLSFMHHDLGYIDLEQRTSQPIDNPFGVAVAH